MIEGEDPENDFAVANAGADSLNDMSVYGVADVRNAVAARNKLAAEQQARYDAQAKEIMARRAGPSFSERMFQLSAALATPTEQRGLGGILANVTPVLAAQQKAKRQGELTRREALEELEAKRLTQQMGLANQDVTTTMAMARLDAAARKSQQPKYVLGQDGKWRIQPGTGNSPPMNARGQYIVSTPEEANMVPTGAEFVYATDKSNKVYWGK